MKLYHPAYEVKKDRRTGIRFLPEVLDGRKVATSDVLDPQAIESLLIRGWLPWPGVRTEVPPGTSVPLPSIEELDAMTVAELRAFATRIEVELPAKATKAEIRELLRAPF